MRRRAFLGLSVGTAAGLAGCTAGGLPILDRTGDGEPADCPALTDVARPVCPGDDGPIAVERSSGTVSGDGWILVVTVTNRANDPIEFNPYAWSVLRATDGDWEQLAPDARHEPWRELPPGGRYAWQLTGGAVGLNDVDQRVFLDLPAGRYAFVVPVRTAEPLGAVAPFEVSA